MLHAISMLLLAGLLVCSASPVRALVCANAAAHKVVATQGQIPSIGQVYALTIFARFQDEADGPREAPAFAADLFKADQPGSLTHFYNEMSHGQFRLAGEALPLWYNALQAGADFSSNDEGTGNFSLFSRQIIGMVDQDEDLSRFDNDGPDGVPNSGDDDGFVDVVFINTLTAPEGFIIDLATGIARLGLSEDYVTNDRSVQGGFIRIRRDSHPNGAGGVLQRAHTFSFAVGSMAHEFGHLLGLPDLYDLDFTLDEGQLDPPQDSAGIGYWGLMGHGTRGWNETDGPNPFCAWSLGELGWIGVANSELRIVRENSANVLFEDRSAGGLVYQVQTLGADEYFLVEHRRPGNSFYERNMPGQGGLLVWRINPQALTNNLEQDKLVDLVCADGLFLDAGFPRGQKPNFDVGSDNLDFWSHDVDYRNEHLGNLGDATDPFDGVRAQDFSPVSNPAAPHGISVVNIRRQGQAMLADLNINERRRAGRIEGATSWSDTIQVVGDLVIAPQGQLVLNRGAVLRFGPDQRGSGVDPGRSELVVHGTLFAVSNGDPVLLTSDQAEPQAGDWAGVWLGQGANLNLNNVRIEYALTGIGGERLSREQILTGLQVHDSGEAGINLVDIQEEILLDALDVRRAATIGLGIDGPARLRVENSIFADNGEAGFVRTRGSLVIENNQFENNGTSLEEGGNLVLGEDTFGQATDNVFRGGAVGIRLERSGAMVVENNQLSGHQLGIDSRSSRPRIRNNHLQQTELAFSVSGFRVPSVVELNAIEGAEKLLVNVSELVVKATNNWWGQDDIGWIGARVEGQVTWQPFLNFDPRRPVNFTLGKNYPNPFNASTQIDYAVGINVSAVRGDVEIVLEVRTITGALVKELERRPAAPGLFSAQWDGTNIAGQRVASGVYYYQLTVPPIVLTQKLLFLK